MDYRVEKQIITWINLIDSQFYQDVFKLRIYQTWFILRKTEQRDEKTCYLYKPYCFFAYLTCFSARDIT